MAEKVLTFNSKYEEKLKMKRNVKKHLFIISFLIVPLISTAIFYFYVNLSSILMSFDVPNGESIFYNFKYIIREFSLNSSILSESLINTLYFFGVNLVIIFPFSYIMSYFIYKKIKMYSFFRIVFFLPSIISGTVLVSLFKKMVAINGPILELINLVTSTEYRPEFLGDSSYAIYTILFYVIWTGAGSNILLLGGAMARIPEDVIDYTKIDGVNPFQEMVKIVTPMIWPTMSMMLIIMMSALFTASGPILLFTEGDFGTYTISYYIFDMVYNRGPGQYPLASAVGLFFTAIGLPLILAVKNNLRLTKEERVLINDTIRALSMEGKIKFLTGNSAWTTCSNLPHIPQIEMHDGSNGLRKDGIKSTCFPSPCALACSFNREIIESVGQGIATECTENNVQMILGPGINIKRSPLCGRNFEYFSEDPFLTGELASSWISGVQKAGIGVCVKHFTANNQESFRMTQNSVIDEKTLNEIYLKPFEIVVKKAKPTSIMTSYNRLNGKYVSENKKLLNDTVRKKWKFDGIFLSDWGGVNNRINSLKAGLDLEMPMSVYGTNILLNAYKKGQIKEKTVNKSVGRILRICLLLNRKKGKKTLNESEIRDIATSSATESIVLLKNDDNILPVKDIKQTVAVIGDAVDNPRIQGSGCAKNDVLWIENFKDVLKSKYKKTEFSFEKGYSLKGEDVINSLEEKALSIAKRSDKVILFLSTIDSTESEGYDRESIAFPKNQLTLLKKIYEVNKNTVVIMQNGSAMDMSFAKDCKGIIESYFLGSGFATALIDVICGNECPSGKLAETFPDKIEDVSSYNFYKGNGFDVRYGEGEYVGYKDYIARNKRMTYPFGFGLSYSNFTINSFTDNFAENNDFDLSKKQISFSIKNCGMYKASETMQLYVEYVDGFSKIRRLIDFNKILLNIGEEKNCSFDITKEKLLQYDVRQKNNILKSGKYRVMIGTSCQNILYSKEINVVSKDDIVLCERNTRIGDILKTDIGKKMVQEKLMGYCGLAIYGNFNIELKVADCPKKDKFFYGIMENLPLRALCNFSNGAFTEEMLLEFIKNYNDEIVKQK